MKMKLGKMTCYIFNINKQNSNMPSWAYWLKPKESL